MKKAFRGRMCAYCSTNPASTGDHVIGRKFFPESLRDDLPQVPACPECNNRKSEYERYAMTVFPFGSLHHAAQEMLQTQVERRMKGDQSLRHDLRNGRKNAVGMTSDGSAVTTSALPFDYDKASGLFLMIIKGLLWHHLRSPFPRDYVIRLFPLTDQGLERFKKCFLSLSPENLQREALADGAFKYVFTRNRDDPFFTVWVLDFYDSLNMCGATERGELLRVHMTAFTGPAQVDHIADVFEEKLMIQ